MVTVYYLKDKFYSEGVFAKQEQLRKLYADGAYEKVADVATNDLEEAWKMLQNGVVTDSWVLNPPFIVKPLVKPHLCEGKLYGWRSASMGDVFHKEDGLFYVEMIGFKRLD